MKQSDVIMRCSAKMERVQEDVTRVEEEARWPASVISASAMGYLLQLYLHSVQFYLGQLRLA